MKRTEQIDAGMLEDVLACLLAPAGGTRRADRSQIRAYLDYLDQSPVDWEGSRIRSGQRTTAIFFALLLPGSTAIVSS